MRPVQGERERERERERLCVSMCWNIHNVFDTRTRDTKICDV